MDRPSALDRLRYAFDNFMSRGTIALIGGLFVVSALLVLAISLLVALSGTLADHEATQGVDFIELVWISLLRTLDPGTMGGDVGTVPFVLSMLAVTLAGIFIISTLIGVISTGIQDKVADLRKGRSRVIERDHTVILGWSAQVFSVINQLAAANAERPGHCLVVLAERDKVEMEDEIRARLTPRTTTRVVCRSGSPIDLDLIDIASPQTSRSIIVLSPEHEDPDAEVIKTLLAITNAPNRRSKPYHIVAELHDPRNLEVARLASRGEAQLVLVGDLIARIAAQTCRQPGLSVVYTELLDFGGDEIHFSDSLGLTGTTFGDALCHFADSSLMGVVPAGGSALLNPAMERPIAADDGLIFVAAQAGSMRAAGPPTRPAEEELLRRHVVRPALPERALVLGWNRRTARVLLELDRYVAEGSAATLVTAGWTLSEVGPLAEELHNLRLTHVEGETTDRGLLDRLNVTDFEHALIMADSDRLDDQRADARTLVTLLHLRDIVANHATPSARRLSIVTEMLDVRNRSLADVSRAEDFIVSDVLASLTVAQLAENPRRQAVLEDLFNVEGAEIYLKPAEDYVVPGLEMDFYAPLEAARHRGEVAIGYRLMQHAEDRQRNYGVELNPRKAARLVFAEGDRLIVLAEN
ncbi:MAG TPA: potassium transporter TrkA [Candidatus Limnocylindria bacterium]|nr:potassium transporter TrkA [Candidatus Limnocylindria bacterium]